MKSVTPHGITGLERVKDMGKEQIYGPTYENGYRKITTNQENYNKFRTPDIVIITEVLRMD
jgi:hypothetical protein